MKQKKKRLGGKQETQIGKKEQQKQLQQRSKQTKQVKQKD